MSQNTDVLISCFGLINGEHITVNGRGLGSVEKGTLEMSLDFSSLPFGYSTLVSALWTACCSSPTFALEKNGGFNLLTIAHANYRCARTFNFGQFGSYDYLFENRLSDKTMTARGIIQGRVSLPPLKEVSDSIFEIMVPLGSDEIQSFARAKFIAVDGQEIPVLILGRYTRITEQEWSCCAHDQIRRSYVTVTRQGLTNLSLEYLTVVEGIAFPELPVHAARAWRERQPVVAATT